MRPQTKVEYCTKGLTSLSKKSLGLIVNYKNLQLQYHRKQEATETQINQLEESIYKLMKYRVQITAYNFQQLSSYLHSTISSNKDNLLEILSIGPGQSYDLIALSEFLKNRQFNYTGIDSDQRYIAASQIGFSSLKYSSFIYGKIEDYFQQFNRQSFDLIILQQPSIVGNKNSENYICYLFRVIIPYLLKKTGQVYISFLLQQDYVEFCQFINNNFRDKENNQAMLLLNNKTIKNDKAKYYDTGVSFTGAQRKPECISIAVPYDFFNQIQPKSLFSKSSCRYLLFGVSVATVGIAILASKLESHENLSNFFQN